MSNITRADLKALLISRYSYLIRRLESMIGSKDNAADALQETWLRLETMPDAATAYNETYLLRMATNAAIDQYRRERRHVHEDEIDEMFQVRDELADPERIVSARSEIDALKDIVRGLSPRRRAILQAARIDGELNREIAARMGISVRLVERELSAALDYCAERMFKSVASNEGKRTGRRKF